MFGIDISHHQGAINWKELSTNKPPIDFIFIKATEGTTYVDPKFESNATGANFVGIPIGFYHFATLNSPNIVQDAKSEADFFLSVIKRAPKPSLPLVLDLETNKAQLGKNDVLGWITTFFDTLKAAGHNDFVLYSYTPFLNENLPSNHNLGGVKLWIAQYRDVAEPTLPIGWKESWLWQYSAKGKIKGIVGDVDLNRSKGSII